MVYADRDSREKWKQGMYEAIETSKRTGAKHALIVPGKLDTKLEIDYQTANVIDCLRELSEIAVKDGVVIVLEPLNRWNHPGLFLTGIPQAFAICRAVNSPSCKLLDDIYHQQITEGNIIPNIDRAWSEIYAEAHHVMGEGAETRDLIMGVRYIDRFERRRGEWKIAHIHYTARELN